CFFYQDLLKGSALISCLLEACTDNDHMSRTKFSESFNHIRDESGWDYKHCNIRGIGEIRYCLISLLAQHDLFLWMDRQDLTWKTIRDEIQALNRAHGCKVVACAGNSYG